MKHLTATLCLTIALIVGFTTTASSQGFEAGKTYSYKEDLPDTDIIQRLAIKIGKDGKTYQTTIFSGKYKNTCPRGKILSENQLQRVDCENVKEADADQILLSTDELADQSHAMDGSLNEPERIIYIYGRVYKAFHRFPWAYERVSTEKGTSDKHFHFTLEKPFKKGYQSTAPVVKVKPKVKRIPPNAGNDPLAQKLITQKD